MVSDLDNKAVMQRIKSVLENDTAVYSAGNDTLIRYVLVGTPMKGKFTMPYCYISFESDDDTPIEPATSSGGFLSLNTSQHIVSYNIVVWIAEKDGETAENKLMDLLLAIKNALKENIELVIPAGLENEATDAKTKAAIRFRTQSMAPLESRGKAVAGFRLVVTYQAYTT